MRTRSPDVSRVWEIFFKIFQVKGFSTVSLARLTTFEQQAKGGIMNRQNLLHTVVVTSLVFLLFGCTSVTTPLPSTATAMPTMIPVSTSTPTPVPSHALAVVKSVLSDDMFVVIIQDTDSGGEKLDTVGLGLVCLGQGIYVVDESGSRLDCLNVGDMTDNPNQIAMIFTGASTQHTYQLVRDGDPPIDLFPEQANANVTPVTTSVQGSGPQVGHWEGEPSVSFDVTSDGKVLNFQMKYHMGGSYYCLFNIEEIAIEDDNTFVFTNLIAPTEINPVAVSIMTNISGEPEIIKTDTGDMIVLQRIIGKFEGADTLTGTGKIWMCEGTAVEGLNEGIEWNAEWKTP